MVRAKEAGVDAQRTVHIDDGMLEILKNYLGKRGTSQRSSIHLLQANTKKRKRPETITSTRPEPADIKPNEKRRKFN